MDFMFHIILDIGLIFHKILPLQSRAQDYNHFLKLRSGVKFPMSCFTLNTKNIDKKWSKRTSFGRTQSIKHKTRSKYDY